MAPLRSNVFIKLVFGTGPKPLPELLLFNSTKTAGILFLGHVLSNGLRGRGHVQSLLPPPPDRSLYRAFRSAVKPQALCDPSQKGLFFD